MLKKSVIFSQCVNKYNFTFNMIYPDIVYNDK